MRRRLWTTAFIASLGLSLLPVPADAAACGKNKPVVTDPKGDATAFANVPSGFPNEASLDVVSAAVVWDARAKTVTFRINVANMDDAPPTIGNGKIFRFDFKYEDQMYELQARKITVPAAESYSLTVQTTPAVVLDDTLKGSFDSKKETVTIVVPVSRFNSAVRTYARSQNKAVPPDLAKGSSLDEFQILAQRYIGPGPAVTATADTAAGGCRYVVG